MYDKVIQSENMHLNVELKHSIQLNSIHIYFK